MTVCTICALLVSKVARINLCYLLWDFDRVDTLAILLWYRKNDCLKRGLFPRIGKGTLTSKCLLALVCDYLAASGLGVAANCTKSKWRR